LADTFYEKVWDCDSRVTAKKKMKVTITNYKPIDLSLAVTERNYKMIFTARRICCEYE
jgi:hypothetical protein